MIKISLVKIDWEKIHIKKLPVKIQAVLKKWVKFLALITSEKGFLCFGFLLVFYWFVMVRHGDERVFGLGLGLGLGLVLNGLNLIFLDYRSSDFP